MALSLKQLVFGGGGGGTAGADLGLLGLRAFAGLAMAFGHGLGKLPPSEGFIGATEGLGFPAPALFAWAAGLSEFVGGLLLALGLATRPAALAVAVTMLVAAFGAHGGDPFGDKEMALLYFAISACFVLTGAGRYSVDRLIAGRPRRLYS